MATTTNNPTPRNDPDSHTPHPGLAGTHGGGGDGQTELPGTVDPQGPPGVVRQSPAIGVAASATE